MHLDDTELPPRSGLPPSASVDAAPSPGSDDAGAPTGTPGCADAESEVLLIETLLGDAADPSFREALHGLAHRGRLERLLLAPTDLPRRRFHTRTDAGTRCFVALPREQRLFDGALVHLTGERAVLVQVGEQSWLRLSAVDLSAALELGHLAGNLHWRVRFEQGLLLVAVEASRASYLARLRELIGRGRVTLHD